MKFVFCFVLGWCLVCGFAGEALAEYDGTDLLDYCSEYINYKGDMEFGLCMGFVLGVRDTPRALWSGYSLAKRIFCLPEGVAPQQEVRVVVKYLEDNPAKLHESAAVLVMGALSGAFPCKGGE